MTILHVMGLSLDANTKTPIVLLQAVEDNRMLPIWIGATEAMSISLALSNQKIPRPLTHDLLLSMLDSLGAQIKAIEINKFDKGTFYADVLVHMGDTMHRIDCRPSDGIALAIRTGAPIGIDPEVFEKSQNAAQKQDGTSFQLITDNNAKTQQPAKLMTKVVQSMQQTNQQNVHTAKVNTDNDEELAKLLNALEPQSTRRM